MKVKKSKNLKKRRKREKNGDKFKNQATNKQI